MIGLRHLITQRQNSQTGCYCRINNNMSLISGLFWKIFYLLPPILYSGGIFFSWYIHPSDADLPFSILSFIAIYAVVLLLRTIVCFAIDMLLVAEAFTFSVVSTMLLIITTGSTKTIFAAGLAFYVFPQDNYVVKHCQTTQFEQDGSSYIVGLCDAAYIQNTTDIGYVVIYDTSGDVMNFQDGKDTNHSLDSREWVRAVRNDSALHGGTSLFEITNFHSSRIYGDFYLVVFDDGDRAGFTPEYGWP